jgi:hypothetical protein
MMPLFMNEHINVEGLNAGAVASVHQKNLVTRAKDGVRNEQSGQIYCLGRTRARRPTRSIEARKVTSRVAARPPRGL